MQTSSQLQIGRATGAAVDPLSDLLEGYREFMLRDYAVEAARYRSLADLGQTPRTLVIACSDSRVDPSRIFNARPGELFVVRNVANLVPPFEEHGDYHGTSAAIEFAVTSLHVERILVLGHARCGGINAFLSRANTTVSPRSFVDKWISLLEPAYAAAAAQGAPIEPAARERWMEQVAIIQSLRNLTTFPFVCEAMQNGSLDLFGAMFDISTGRLQVIDRDSNKFVAV